MKRFITYLIMAAATLYTSILYGSNSFLMLFYVELLLPVVLILVCIPVLRGVRVRMQIPVPVVEKGRGTMVEFHLQNGAAIPSGRIAVQVTCRYPMNQKPEKTWFYGRVSAGRAAVPSSAKIRAEYSAGCVGNVKMEITKVRCYDLLGLVSLPLPKSQWKQMEPETLLVLPRMSGVPVFVSRQSRDFAGESEEYSKERGGDDPSETFRIRDYQPGDKLRSVHWKLSVKTEELMVCERSLPLGCPVVFYLNLYQPLLAEGRHGKGRHAGKRRAGRAHNKVSTIKQDGYLQIAASVSQAMVREGCRHYIVWFDSERMDIRRFRVEKEEDVYEMLLRLGMFSMYQEKRDLEELYRQKYHESPCITKLELRMDFCLYQNDIRLVKYSSREEKLDRQLQRTEITV